MRLKIALRFLPLVLGLWVQCIFATHSFAQTPQRITGKVTDENGNPLRGASVIQKGGAHGTSTDSAGTFTISINGAHPVLVISQVEMLAQEVKVDANNSVLNVQMKTNPKSNLTDVVVVGYGTQRKADLTGAVASVSSKDFATKPFTSPDQILAGRVSGVSISNRSGDPAAPVEVRIRGVGTVGNNQPLFVIDGVPITVTSNVIVNSGSAQETNPLAGINPSDIESIDVLKDASATAIFGARAANGVITITTKKGKDGRMSLSYDGYTGRLSVPQSRVFKVLGVSDYIALQKELGNDFSTFASKPNVDWQNQIFKTGIANNQNLNASGGTANANYSISGGYLKQSGIERAQGLERYTLRITSEIKATKWVKFGESILLSSVNRDVQGEDAQFAAYTSSLNAPFFQAYDPSGQYNPVNSTTSPTAATAVNYAWLTDPSFEFANVTNRKIVGSVYAEFDITKHLKYRASAGLDANLIDGLFQLHPIDPTVLGGKGTNLFKPDLLDQEKGVESTITLANTLTYTNQWDKHKLTALVGYEQSDYRFDKDRIQGTTLLFPGINVASLAQSVSASQIKDQWAINGILGRIFYSYNDRYLFTVNLRNDNSSRFSSANRSQLFPSGSIGWRLSEETFVKRIKAINDLKLRVSYGNTGNQFTGANFSYISTLGSTIGYVIGSGQTVVNGVAPLALANANLHWETTTQADLGVDFTLFDYKLSGTIDYFDKTTNGMLIAAPVAYTTGYYATTDINAGQMKNKGLELSLNYKNKVGQFTYSIGGNYTVVNNEVTQMPATVPYIANTDGSKRISPGYSLGYFYGYKMTGIYQTDADAVSGTGISTAKAGDVKFADVNGDKVIDANDRTVIGRAIPKFYYGFNLSLAYKGLDISVFGQGVGGVDIYNQTKQTLESMSGGNNQLTSVLNRWTATNHSNTMPRAASGDPSGNNQFSTRWLENGSYLRVKNIQLGYNFSSEMLKIATKGFISYARLYIGLLNPFTITKYTGYDPEVTRPPSFTPGESQLNNGIDAGGAPQPFMVQAGWQVRF